MTNFCPVPGCTAVAPTRGHPCFRCVLAGWRCDGTMIYRLPALLAGAYASGD